MKMKNKNLGYSSKNIPIPLHKILSRPWYTKFNRSLRWKAFLFDSHNHTTAEKETYGFTFENAPPQHKDLTVFENDRYEMVKSIQIKTVRNQFQKQLASDSKKVKKSKNMFASADKTTNLYELQVSHYCKLLDENISSTYKKKQKKNGNEPLNHINTENQAIARDLKLDDIESNPLLSEKNLWQ